jgi:hypothetical protein
MAHQPVARREFFGPSLIARCGMNCALCIAYRRERNRCPGCDADPAHAAHHCTVCRILHCDERGTRRIRFCSECGKFPCARLRHMDKRYRTKYGMSVVGNLRAIRELGMASFVMREKVRWTCPGCGGLLCVHKKECLYCGRPRT